MRWRMAQFLFALICRACLPCVDDFLLCLCAPSLAHPTGGGGGCCGCGGFGLPLPTFLRPLVAEPGLSWSASIFLLGLLPASIFAKMLCGGSEKPLRTFVQWLQGVSRVHPEAKQSEVNLARCFLTRRERLLHLMRTSDVLA